MKHFTSTQNFVSGLQHFIGGLNFSTLNRTGQGQHELNAHLRHDVGEDDVRPIPQVSLLHQHAAHAITLDAMILRGF